MNARSGKSACLYAGVPACRADRKAWQSRFRAGTPSYQAVPYWTEDGETGRSGTDAENLPGTEIAGESEMRAWRNPRTPETPENRCAAILGG